MKRTFATLGVVGLGLISITAPAFAADEVICHATSSESNPYRTFSIDQNGINGHGDHSDDIIPPNPLLPSGLNWPAGMATYYTYCATPPVVVDPPVEEEDPPVEEEDPPVVVDPPVEEEDPPVAAVPAAVVPPAVVPPAAVTPAAKTPAPKAAAKVPAAAAAPVSQGTNQGFNAQTAAGGDAGNATPTWLGGLGALIAAGLAVAARRRSRTDAPTAG